MSLPPGKIRRVAAWLKRCPADVAASAVLVLATRGLTERVVVTTWPGTGRDVAETTAESILHAAQDDCDGRGDSTDYEVQLVDADGKAHATLPLKCEAIDGSLVESATVEGILKQTLRHQEVMMRLTAESIGRSMEMMTRMASTLTSRVDALERRRQSALDAEYEAMQVLVKAGAEDGEDERKTAREEKLLQLAEMFLEHQLGKGEAAE